ncbi:MAG: 50S ribosomal protein L11 methyltransferase [Gammaproteobacteria bacterium]|nr:50S ribosomal protein L11 methyltransferase [Gammaproteobacteria bacterium]
MGWRRLSIVAGESMADAIAEALERSGAGAVSLLDAGDQPLYEPALGTTPIWAATRIEGLYEESVDWEAIAAGISARLGLCGAQWICHRLEDRTWERAWMDRFRPMRFGERLWIYPSNYGIPDGLRTVVRLDPGLAFGTGTHPTTALCLEAIERRAMPAERIVDYGCGCGVLALAALCLGGSHAWFFDTDAQALTAAHDNAERNEWVHQMTMVTDREQLSTVHPDLLLANILAGPLVALAPELSQLLAPGGTIVLSGILVEQAEPVAAAYTSRLELVDMHEREGWVCITATRAQSSVVAE